MWYCCLVARSRITYIFILLRLAIKLERLHVVRHVIEVYCDGLDSYKLNALHPYLRKLRHCTDTFSSLIRWFVLFLGVWSCYYGYWILLKAINAILLRRLIYLNRDYLFKVQRLIVKLVSGMARLLDLVFHGDFDGIKHVWFKEPPSLSLIARINITAIVLLRHRLQFVNIIQMANGAS